MNAASLIPGIRKHPDLELQMDARLRRHGRSGCDSCGRNKLISRYRELLRKREERDSP